MTLNEGVLGTFSFKGDHAHTMDHPPVLCSGAVKQNNGVYPAGLVLMRDGDGTLVPWDGAATPTGVCDLPCDTATLPACVYLAHGTVRAAVLTKAGGAALTATETALLAQATIHSV